MKPIDNIFYTLKDLGIDFVQEYKFDQKRRFKLDFAILEHKIGIEYEGIFADKSRHTSLTGYSRDVEKYNLAVTQGWRVLRYTAMNYKNLRVDLEAILYLSK